jgi:AraC family transcriptional activator of pobA
MTSGNEIPVLKPEISPGFHFETIEWQQPLFAEAHHELFHINRLEDFRDKIKFPLPPHRKTVYDFIFLTQGESKRSKGLNEYTFGADTFFFLPANQITTHQSMSEDACGFFCHFDVQIFRLGGLQMPLENFSFLQFLANPLLKIPKIVQKPILNILERLKELYQEDQKGDFGLIATYLLALLIEVKKFVPDEKKLPKNSAVLVTQQYKNALMQYIYQKQYVLDYADLLNVTPNHLNKCVKTTTDKTAQDMLNEMLILEAKSLLKYSNLQIAEIAVKLCNQTPSNFARFFKSQTGISPKEYQ